MATINIGSLSLSSHKEIMIIQLPVVRRSLLRIYRQCLFACNTGNLPQAQLTGMFFLQDLVVLECWFIFGFGWTSS